MQTRLPCLPCALALACAATLAPAQKSHDALADARNKARAENQRVLLLLRGGEPAIDAALVAGLGDYRQLGKLLRYEYQLAAQPGDSLAARHLVDRLGLGEPPTLPMLVVLDTDDRVLGRLDGKAMRATSPFDLRTPQTFLEQHVSAPQDAEQVLATGIAAARKSKRQVFVYLSAPW